MAYAEKTTVSSYQSRGQIEKLLAKHGAKGFYYGSESDCAMLGFKILGERGEVIAVKITMAMPDIDKYKLTPTGLRRTDTETKKQWEQACRSAWRALLLIIKAKLEAVERGITTIEREFMADILLADGSTIGEQVARQQSALDEGSKRLMLPA